MFYSVFILWYFSSAIFKLFPFLSLSYLHITWNDKKSIKNIILGHFLLPKQHLDELGSISTFYQKRVILAIFGGVGRLRGQFQAPKLHLIDSTMERAMVRHGLRNILIPGMFVMGPPRLELQCKTCQFSGLPTLGSNFSWPVRAQLKPSRSGAIPT